MGGVMTDSTDLPNFGDAKGHERVLGEHALARRTDLELPVDLPLEMWRRVGQEMFAISDASAWWLGDWLIYGQNRYPERYRRALQETGLNYQTLRNYAWIARRFDASSRRPELSIQHHAEVAGLSPADRSLWLERAQHFGWSRNTLRRHLRASRSPARGAGAAAPPVTLVRVTAGPVRVNRWREAAARSGSSLTDWAFEILDQVAGETERST